MQPTSQILLTQALPPRALILRALLVNLAALSLTTSLCMAADNAPPINNIVASQQTAGDVAATDAAQILARLLNDF